MTSTLDIRRPAPDAPRTSRRSATIALTIIVSIQLMVVLDATVVNVALPDIKGALGFSTTGLSWVLNAYSLTFGGLLLLGARAGDILGRRPVLLAGIALFSVASLAGGFASDANLLLASRAVQGIGAAIAAPQALALLTTMFAEGRERTRALGIYSAVSISGAAIGLVVGGMLTDWVSWRWVFFVNVPVGIALLVLGPRYLADSPRRTGQLDIAGALTGTVGMTSIVYGFVSAGSRGWGNTETIAAFAVGVLLIATFLVVERSASQPITPLRLFADRNRASAYAARLFLVAAMFGMFFFLTQFMQRVIGLSPLETGFAFLPLSIALFGASQLSARVLIELIGAKRTMVLGLSLSAVAMVWLTQIDADSTYDYLLPALVVFGIGNGLAFVPLTAVALTGVDSSDAGAASGLVNVMQQVGGSLGLSVLVTIFGRSTARLSGSPTETLAHGVSMAFIGSAAFAIATLVVIAALVREPKPPAFVPETVEVEPAETSA
jgi:EmrB/QacA subfamily drug resistance transporter